MLAGHWQDVAAVDTRPRIEHLVIRGWFLSTLSILQSIDCVEIKGCQPAMQEGMNHHPKNHQVNCPLCGRQTQDNGSSPDQVIRAIRRRTHQVETLLEGLLKNSAQTRNQSNRRQGHRQNFLSLMKVIERYRAFISQTTLQLKSAQAVAKRGPSAAERTERNVLSPREREIVHCLAEGLSNKATASELGINVRTVETHRARIMLKLNLRSLAELVQYAIRVELIDV